MNYGTNSHGASVGNDTGHGSGHSYATGAGTPAATTPGIALLVLSDLTLNAIQAEATRAHLKHQHNSMLYGTDDRRHRILAEEVGEVARELNDAEIDGRYVDRDKLVKELIQVAAMAATWIEALEGDHP